MILVNHIKGEMHTEDEIHLSSELVLKMTDSGTAKSLHDALKKICEFDVGTDFSEKNEASMLSMIDAYERSKNQKMVLIRLDLSDVMMSDNMSDNILENPIFLFRDEQSSWRKLVCKARPTNYKSVLKNIKEQSFDLDALASDLSARLIHRKCFSYVDMPTYTNNSPFRVTINHPEYDKIVGSIQSLEKHQTFISKIPHDVIDHHKQVYTQADRYRLIDCDEYKVSKIYNELKHKPREKKFLDHLEHIMKRMIQEANDIEIISLVPLSKCNHKDITELLINRMLGLFNNMPQIDTKIVSAITCIFSNASQTDEGLSWVTSHSIMAIIKKIFNKLKYFHDLLSNPDEVYKILSHVARFLDEANYIVMNKGGFFYEQSVFEDQIKTIHSYKKKDHEAVTALVTYIEQAFFYMSYTQEEITSHHDVGSWHSPNSVHHFHRVLLRSTDSEGAYALDFARGEVIETVKQAQINEVVNARNLGNGDIKQVIINNISLFSPFANNKMNKLRSEFRDYSRDDFFKYQSFGRVCPSLKDSMKMHIDSTVGDAFDLRLVDGHGHSGRGKPNKPEDEIDVKSKYKLCFIIFFLNHEYFIPQFALRPPGGGADNWKFDKQSLKKFSSKKQETYAEYKKHELSASDKIKAIVDSDEKNLKHAASQTHLGKKIKANVNQDGEIKSETIREELKDCIQTEYREIFLQNDVCTNAGSNSFCYELMRYIHLSIHSKQLDLSRFFMLIEILDVFGQRFLLDRDRAAIACQLFSSFLSLTGKENASIRLLIYLYFERIVLNLKDNRLHFLMPYLIEYLWASKEKIDDLLQLKEYHGDCVLAIEQNFLTDILKKFGEEIHQIKKSKAEALAKKEDYESPIEDVFFNAIVQSYLDRNEDDTHRQPLYLSEAAFCVQDGDQSSGVFQALYKQLFPLDARIDTMWSRSEAILNDNKVLSNALNYYIPLNCMKLAEGDLDVEYDLMSTVDTHLKNQKDNSLILLEGKSGSGKSLFGWSLVKKYWSNYKPQERSCPVPLYINLRQLNDPFQDWIQQALQESDFNESEIADFISQLQSNSRSLILFLDGYDELKAQLSIFSSETLKDTANTKIIIACRESYLKGNYREVMTDYRKRGLIELLVKPFNKVQRVDFISKVHFNTENSLFGDLNNFRYFFECLLSFVTECSCKLTNQLKKQLAHLINKDSLKNKNSTNIDKPHVVLNAHDFATYFSGWDDKTSDAFLEIASRWLGTIIIDYLGVQSDDQIIIEDILEDFKYSIEKIKQDPKSIFDFDFYNSVLTYNRYSDWQKEQESIKSKNDAIEGLNIEDEFLESPFILRLLLEVLPKLKNQPYKINKAHIYGIFTELWRESKSREIREKWPKIRLSSHDIEKYSRDLAFHMYRQNDRTVIPMHSGVYQTKHHVEKDVWKHFKESSNEGVKLCREHALLIINSRSMQFLHKSIRDYYIAVSLLDNISSATQNIEEDEDLINRVNLAGSNEILLFLKELIRNDQHCQDRYIKPLFNILKLSKNDPSCTQKSSNAATILAFIDASFFRKDLSGIRLRGADLTGINLDSVNLSDADLSGCCLDKAWLRFTNLEGANLKNVQFSEKPYLIQNAPIRSMVYATTGVRGEEYLITIRDTSVDFWDFLTGKRKSRSCSLHDCLTHRRVPVAEEDILKAFFDHDHEHSWLVLVLRDEVARIQINPGSLTMDSHQAVTEVNQYAFSASQHCLVIVTKEADIKLMDLKNLAQVQTIQLTDHFSNNIVQSIIFNGAGDKFFVKNDELIELYSITCLPGRSIIIEKDDRISLDALNLNRGYFLNFNNKNQICVISVSDSPTASVAIDVIGWNAQLSNHHDYNSSVKVTHIKEVIFRHDINKFAVVSDKNDIIVWGFDENKQEQHLFSEPREVKHLSFSASGDYISWSSYKNIQLDAIGRRQYVVYTREMQRKNILDRSSQYNHSPISSMTHNEDGKLTVCHKIDSEYAKYSIVKWDIQSGRRLDQKKANENPHQRNQIESPKEVFLEKIKEKSEQRFCEATSYSGQDAKVNDMRDLRKQINGWSENNGHKMHSVFLYQYFVKEKKRWEWEFVYIERSGETSSRLGLSQFKNPDKDYEHFSECMRKCKSYLEEEEAVCFYKKYFISSGIERNLFLKEKILSGPTMTLNDEMGCVVTNKRILLWGIDGQDHHKVHLIAELFLPSSLPDLRVDLVGDGDNTNVVDVNQYSNNGFNHYPKNDLEKINFEQHIVPLKDVKLSPNKSLIACSTEQGIFIFKMLGNKQQGELVYVLAEFSGVIDRFDYYDDQTIYLCNQMSQVQVWQSSQSATSWVLKWSSDHALNAQYCQIDGVLNANSSHRMLLKQLHASGEPHLHGESHSNYQAIHLAILKNDTEAVRKMIHDVATSVEREEMINAKTIESQETPLHIAASRSNVEIVEILLKEYPRFYERDALGRIPADCIEFHSDHLSISSILPYLDSALRERNFFHVAVLDEKPKIFKFLLDYIKRNNLTALNSEDQRRLDLDSLDQDGKSPIYYAIEKGHSDVAKQMFEWNKSRHKAGLKLDVEDGFGCSILWKAISEDLTTPVDDSGFVVINNQGDQESRCGLLVNAVKNDEITINLNAGDNTFQKWVMDEGKKVDYMGHQKAVSLENLRYRSIQRLLIEHDGERAFSIFKALSEYELNDSLEQPNFKFNLNAIEYDGKTPLLIAIEQDKQQFIDRILDLEWNRSVKEIDCHVKLGSKAADASGERCKYENQDDFNINDRSPDTSLYEYYARSLKKISNYREAIVNPPQGMVDDRLLRSLAYVEGYLGWDLDGKSGKRPIQYPWYLHFVIKQKKSGILKQLLNQALNDVLGEDGVNINQRDKEGYTALYLAVKQNYTEGVKCLLDIENTTLLKDIDLNAICEPASLSTLHHAIDNKQILNLILNVETNRALNVKDHQINLRIKRKLQSTQELEPILFSVIENDDKDLINRLMSKDLNSILQENYRLKLDETDAHENSLLQVLIRRGLYKEVLYFIRIIEGELIHGHPKIFSCVFDKNNCKAIQWIGRTNEKDENVLHTIADSKDPNRYFEVVRFIITNDQNAQNDVTNLFKHPDREKQQTFLHRFVVHGDLTKIQEFINDMDLNAVDHVRNTPLHTAILSQRFDNVKVLLDNKADISCCNKDHKSPIALLLDTLKTDDLPNNQGEECLAKAKQSLDHVLLRCLKDERDKQKYPDLDYTIDVDQKPLNFLKLAVQHECTASLESLFLESKLNLKYFFDDSSSILKRLGDDALYFCKLIYDYTIHYLADQDTAEGDATVLKRSFLRAADTKKLISEIAARILKSDSGSDYTQLTNDYMDLYFETLKLNSDNNLNYVDSAWIFQMVAEKSIPLCYIKQILGCMAVHDCLDDITKYIDGKLKYEREKIKILQACVSRMKESPEKNKHSHFDSLVKAFRDSKSNSKACLQRMIELSYDCLKNFQSDGGIFCEFGGQTYWEWLIQYQGNQESKIDEQYRYLSDPNFGIEHRIEFMSLYKKFIISKSHPFPKSAPSSTEVLWKNFIKFVSITWTGTTPEPCQKIGDFINSDQEGKTILGQAFITHGVPQDLPKTLVTNFDANPISPNHIESSALLCLLKMPEVQKLRDCLAWYRTKILDNPSGLMQHALEIIVKTRQNDPSLKGRCKALTEIILYSSTDSVSKIFFEKKYFLRLFEITDRQCTAQMVADLFYKVGWGAYKKAAAPIHWFAWCKKESTDHLDVLFHGLVIFLVMTCRYIQSTPSSRCYWIYTHNDRKIGVRPPEPNSSEPQSYSEKLDSIFANGFRTFNGRSSDTEVVAEHHGISSNRWYPLGYDDSFDLLKLFEDKTLFEWLGFLKNDDYTKYMKLILYVQCNHLKQEKVKDKINDIMINQNNVSFADLVRQYEKDMGLHENSKEALVKNGVLKSNQPNKKKAGATDKSISTDMARESSAEITDQLTSSSAQSQSNKKARQNQPRATENIQTGGASTRLYADMGRSAEAKAAKKEKKSSPPSGAPAEQDSAVQHPGDHYGH